MLGLIPGSKRRRKAQPGMERGVNRIIPVISSNAALGRSGPWMGQPLPAWLVMLNIAYQLYLDGLWETPS